MSRLKPRSATKVLYQGDDMSRLSELKRAIDIAKRQAQADMDGASRLGDDNPSSVDTDPRVVSAQREFDEFVDEAAERAVTVVIQAIGRRRFTELVAAHQPRMVPNPARGERALGETEAPPLTGPAEVEHEDDAGYGVNTETFPRALLTFREGEFSTIAEPKFESEADRESFIDDDLAEGDYDELWIAAFMLNRSPSADPKAARSTSVYPSTDET